MFTLFKKKKLTEEQLANYFVNTLLQLTDEGFKDVATIINSDPEFVQSPEISDDNADQFLLIVIAGNLKLLSVHFDAMRDVRLADKIVKRLSEIYSVDPSRMRESIAQMQSWMSRINHPSKNTHYAMSKAIFFKYGLNEFQGDYFRNMKTPNPIFLKRLDEVVATFIIDWESIRDQYRIA